MTKKFSPTYWKTERNFFLTEKSPGAGELSGGVPVEPGEPKQSGVRRSQIPTNEVGEPKPTLTVGKPAGAQAGRKVKEPDFKILERQLFISLNGATNIKNSLLHFTAALRRLNEKVRDLRQLRQSVITKWLKTEDVRKVQHKAGHRYVSTTERYQVSNLEDLQEALNIHHPLSG